MKTYYFCLVGKSYLSLDAVNIQAAQYSLRSFVGLPWREIRARVTIVPPSSDCDVLHLKF